MRKNPGYWNDERLHQELIVICAGTGIFPSVQDLKGLGRNDLATQISQRGGYVAWSSRLGFNRKDSESDKGWAGEKDCLSILRKLGFKADPTNQLRAPYDILVNDCVRIDVKSANYAEYGVCRGWFYRNGKHTSADVLMLFQVDTRDIYYLPWYLCPTTNITIARDGGKYKAFKNKDSILWQMVKSRGEEVGQYRLWIPEPKNSA